MRFFFLLFTLFIAGCTTAPKLTPVSNPDATWQEHQHKLGMIRLSGSKDIGELSDGEQSFQAPDAELLLLEHTGIRMPVNGLRYWLLGLPQPDKKVKNLKLDVAGRMLSLQQEEWQVTVDRYQKYNGKTLPAKLVINNHHLKVRLIVDQWQLNIIKS